MKKLERSEMKNLKGGYNEGGSPGGTYECEIDKCTSNSDCSDFGAGYGCYVDPHCSDKKKTCNMGY